MDCLPQSAVLLSVIVVGNIIGWMVMIAGIGLGVMHLGNCPAQPLIPIYLIVLGVSSLLALLLTYTQTSRMEGAARILNSVCISVLYLFNFCWFISGTVWVYAIYPPNYSAEEDGYCNKTIYLFAFFFTSLCWALVIVMFLFGGCFLLLTCRKILFGGRGMSHLPNRSYGATGDI